MNQILNILDSLSLGPYYFSTAVLMRNTILINGITFNGESWYNLTNQDVEELSRIDRQYLCRILNVPHSVPSESLYLELGLQNIDTIIRNRRMNYTKDVISRDN